MGLQEQTIVVRFAAGVETKADPKTVPIAKLLAAENVVLTKGGSLSKRNGYDMLSRQIDGGGVYGAGVQLAARGDELALFAGGRMLSWRPSEETWSDVGSVSAVTHTERPIIKTGTTQTSADAWAAEGVVVAAWEDSRGGVWMSVLEEDTDRVLRRAEQIDALGTAPKVMRVGDVFHVYWLRAGEIRIIVINPASYLGPVTVAVLADGVTSTAPCFDVDATTRPGEPAIMVWPTVGGGVRVAYVDASGVIGSPVTGHPTSVEISTVALNGGPVAVAWSGEAMAGAGAIAVLSILGTTDALYNIIDDDDLSINYFQEAAGGMAAPSATRCSVAFGVPPEGSAFRLWLAVESAAALPQNASCRFRRITGDMLSFVDEPAKQFNQATGTIRGHGLASRLFVQDGAAYVVLAHEVPFFPYAALVRLDEALTVDVAGRLLVGVCEGLPKRSVLPAVPRASNAPGVRTWPGLYRELAAAELGSEEFAETGIRLCRMDFADGDALQSSRLGADLVIAGSCPLRYDGDTVAELGFHTAPDGVIVATPGTGSGSLTAGVWSYQFFYEEIDAAGEIHPGPMSIPVEVELTGGENQVSFEIPTYRLTGKRRVRIGGVRTEQGDDSESPQFYRVTSLSPAATGANGYLLNDPDVDTVTFVDGLSDEALLLRERAYTNFGILSNDPAPLGALVAGGKNRLIFSDASDPNAVRYSQPRRDGYGVEISEDLRLALDPSGGKVTALAVLDDAVVVWKRGATYFFAGPGPLPNPDAAPQIGFSDPQLVTSDVGCISPRSIAITPIGVIFKSARGYHLIDRARQVRYVGAPVELYNDLSVVAAVALPNRTQILILHSDGPGLLYDYFFGEWFTFSNHAALAGVVAGEQFYYLRNDVEQRVASENRTSYLDGNREIRLYIETAWIRYASYIQGWQKIWYANFVGAWKSPHKLRVRIATDYRTGWGPPIDCLPDAVYDPANYGEGDYGAGPYGGVGDQLYQSRIHVSEQGQAIRFSIEDIPDGEIALAASFEIAELLLTGGTVRAAVKPAPNRSF